MKKLTIFAIVLGLSISGCKKDEPAPVQDNEFISTMRLTFTEGTNKLVYSAKDLDGDGGKAPVIDVIKLLPNKIYTVTTEFLDETKTPAVNLTSEIKAESAEHLIIFEPNSASLLSVVRTDKDSRNFEVGLTATAKTSAALNGTMKVTLKHQPEVGGMPTKNGTASVGTTDFEGIFTVEVK